MLGALGGYIQNAIQTEKDRTQNAYNDLRHPVQYAQQQFQNAINQKKAPQQGIGQLGSFAPQIGPF